MQASATIVEANALGPMLAMANAPLIHTLRAHRTADTARRAGSHPPLVPPLAVSGTRALLMIRALFDCYVWKAVIALANSGRHAD